MHDMLQHNDLAFILSKNGFLRRGFAYIGDRPTCQNASRIWQAYHNAIVCSPFIKDMDMSDSCYVQISI